MREGWSGFAAARAERVAVVTEALSAWELDAIVAVLVRHGVPAVEPTIGAGGHLSERDPEHAGQAGARIANAGIQLCGLAVTSALPLGSDGLLAVLEIAAAIGAPGIRVFAPPYDGDREAEAQLDEATTALSALCDVGANGVRVLIEPAQDSVIPSPELARRVLDDSGRASAGVVYDPANMVIEGHLQPPYALGLLGTRVRHVHVKNHVRERRSGDWRIVSTGLEDGLVDWPRTFAALHDAGYDGWFSIDHLAGPATEEQLESDLGALRALVGVPLG
jgi:sugar phosphate isomerase/epimerase